MIISVRSYSICLNPLCVLNNLKPSMQMDDDKVLNLNGENMYAWQLKHFLYMFNYQ